MANVLEVGSKSCAHAGFLGRGVDADEDQICLSDSLVDIRREKEVATACLADDVLEAWFVDREFVIWAIPRINAGLIEVDNGDLDMRAL